MRVLSKSAPSILAPNSNKNEFEKWRAIRACVGGVLAWVTWWRVYVGGALAWVAWVAYLRGWRARVGDVGGVLA